jgi:mannose-6-phosphate isomerase-like protein (cupin superfamily)
VPGFEYQDTGIGAATKGLAGARVVRRAAGADGAGAAQQHDTEFCFYFVLSGEADFCYGDERLHLKSDDSITVPATLRYTFGVASPDFTLLEVTLPDAVALTEAVD